MLAQRGSDAGRDAAPAPPPLCRRLTAWFCIFWEIRALSSVLNGRFCIFREIRALRLRLTARIRIFREIAATPRARYSVRSAVTGSFFAAMRLGASPAMNDNPTEMSTSAIPGTNGTAARFSTPATW